MSVSTLAFTTQIVPTEAREIDLAALKNNIQAEMDRQNLGCTVGKIYKIRGSDQHTVVIETTAPADSPVSELVVMGIIAIILGIIGAVVYIYSVGFREKRWDNLLKLWQETWHDTVQGLTHKSVEDMITWKQQNAPDHFEKYPFWCPYCGCEFSDEAKRDDHIKICPDAPVIPPIFPGDTTENWKPGIYLNYLIQLLGYRTTGTRQGLLQYLRRR
jgi:hypothetical protein